MRNARQKCGCRPGDALLIIDVINDSSFERGEQVLPWALKPAKALAPFKKRAERAGMPIVYVNDHFGKLHSSFHDVFAHCTREASRGKEICRLLKPKRGFFVLKPRPSGFHHTSLTPLLEHLSARRLILAGIATNLCVLFTAHDAHMSRYPLIVLSDCCAAETNFDHDVALGQLARFCHATICRSTEFAFTKDRK